MNTASCRAFIDRWIGRLIQFSSNERIHYLLEKKLGACSHTRIYSQMLILQKRTSQVHQKRKALVKYIRKENKSNSEAHQLSDRGKSKILIMLNFLSNTTKVLENVTTIRVTIVGQHYCMKQSQIILSPYRIQILQIMYIKSSIS